MKTFLGMESFLPTEIARLVYGYLIEENCESAARLFLETSLHLRECLMVTKKGRRFNTQVSGHNLVDILDKLCEVTCIVKAHIDKNTTETKEENNLLEQLRTLLIPVEEKKVRYKKAEPLKNTELSENHVSGLYDTTIPALPERNENIVDGLCHLAYTSQTDSSQEKCNNEQIDKSGESTVCQDTNPQGQKISERNTDILSSTNNKEKSENNVNSSVKNDCFLNPPQHVNIESNHSDIQSIQLGIENQLCNSETTANKEVDLQTNNITADLPEVTNVNIATTSDSAYSMPSLSAVNNMPLPSPSLPVAVTQMCNQNPPALTNVRFQLNNSSKIHVSLLNQHQAVQETDYLKHSQPPLTYSLMSPFVRSPAAIYIKPPAKNPIIKNIFTSDHRPIEKPSERLLLIKPRTSARVTTPNSKDLSLKDGNELSSETIHRKNEKHLSDSPVIKRSGVRTRGGYVKRGGKYQRRVKAHLPHKTTVQEDKTDLSVGNEQNSDEQPQPCSSDMPNVEADTSDIQTCGHLCESAQDITAESKKTDHERKMTDSGGTSEKTEQTIKNLRKRISLSVPRRGNHIRALDFKTPTKNHIYTRRAITSPKQIHASRASSLKKSLRNLRGALFKSPTQKKENKAWDADLRMYTAESTDIPTSVGLQRRNKIQTSNDKMSDKKRGSTMSPKKTSHSDSPPSEIRSESAPRNEETNDDLADKIQKEVLSVIGEDDINLIGENTNLISDSELDKIIREDTATSTTTNNTAVSIQSRNYIEQEESPNNSVQEEKKIVREQYSQNISGTNRIFEAEERHNILEISNSSLMTPVSKVIEEHRQILENGLLTPGTPLTPERHLSINSTPLKECIDTKNETTLMKLVSPNISLTCQDSLEASLIKECTRIESEKLGIESNEDMQKDDVFEKNPETTFSTPEKTISKLNYVNRIVTSNDIDVSPSNTQINQEGKIDKRMNMLDAVNIKNSVNISDTFVSQTPRTTQMENISLDSSPKLDISPLPIKSVNEDNNKKKLSEVNEVMNFNKHSSEQFAELNSVTEETSNKVDKLIKNGRAEITNPNLLSPNEEKNPSQENSQRTSQRKVRSKSEQVKVKNRRNTRNEIDCSKLIAQCLQSAKENLYGPKNKLTSSLTGSTAKPSKAECSSKSLKINRRLNITPDKKNKNNINDTFLRAKTLLPSRIKYINELLFSDTNSSTSDNSDLSVSPELKSQFNELSNYGGHQQSANIQSNNLSTTSSPARLSPGRASHNREENYVYPVDGFVGVEKEKRSPVLNTSKLELSLEKRSYSKEKEEVVRMPPNQQKKYSTTVEGNSSTKTDNVLEKSCLPNEDNYENRQSSVVLSPNKHTTEVTDRMKSTRREVLCVPPEHIYNDLNNEYKKNSSINYVKSNTDCEYDKDTIRNDIRNNPKQNCDKHSDLSRQLNDYVYTFTLTLDGANVTKQLRVSPIYNIFEMESMSESQSKHSKRRTDKECHIQLDSEDRSKKRKLDNDKDTVELPIEGGSSKSSFCDDKKFDSNKKYRRESEFMYKDTFHSRSERRRGYRYDEPRKKRSSRMGERSYVRESYSQRYRHEYTPPRFRRYSSPPRRWPSRRKTTRRIELSPKVETPKWNSFRTKEGSAHRYPKERVDNKKHEEIKKTHDLGSRLQFKNENSNSRCSATTNTINPAKERKEPRITLDKEDGELSESSVSAYSLIPALVNASSETQRIAESIPPVDEDTRAKLKKLNLDHFLSMLHGTEK